MKIELTAFAHSANGLSLTVIPETDVEKSLLKGLWKHGNLEVDHDGYSVRWKLEESSDGKDGD